MVFKLHWEDYFPVERRVEVDGEEYLLKVPQLEPAKWEALWSEIEKDENRFPYWMEAWNTQFALAKYLKEDRGFLVGRVLEIAGGAGGLVQLVSLDRVSHYCFTDLLPEACAFVQGNNSLLNLSCFPMDFFKPCLKQKFERIVCCDILYEQRLVIPLLHFLDRYLEKGGRALIADPNRSGREDLYDTLRQNWAHYLNMVPVELSVDGNKRCYHIYQLTK